uniref:Uncharacterized protein n=1 Tax=Romanomermis culicivorax TaxID=13658 RepID=A0A915JN69_ROMCU
MGMPTEYRHLYNAMEDEIFEYRPLASDLLGIQHTYSYSTGEGTITKLGGKISPTKTESLKGEDKQQAGEKQKILNKYKITKI